jgi:triacylglycerol lipase
MGRPVLLVHGIWDQGVCFDAMRSALERAGCGPTRALDLSPNDGSGTIESLAAIVDHAARDLADGERFDLVGFSMGALVSRYWLQRMNGKARTRRFVSISGPHAGTVTAHFVPKRGIAQMRPGSALLNDLASDPDPFGDVEVHTLWTPYDLMIVPAQSSRLPHAKSEHRLPLALHRWMITHPRSLHTVATILTRD